MDSITRYWDTAADTFDEEPDHGLLDARTRAAWARCLAAWLPPAPADVLDAGCGTGTLSLLAAELGHRTVGVDLSPRLAELARTKPAAFDAPVVVGDASDPPFAPGAFDVVLARHLLWTLPDPKATLRRWIRLLRPGGRLVLVEGRWAAQGNLRPYAEGADAMPWTGGVTADDLTAALASLVRGRLVVERLDDPELWGRAVEDERYAVVAPVWP